MNICTFPKMRGGVNGRLDFSVFHPFWWCHPSLRLFRPLDLSAPGARVHVGHWLQQWAKKRTKRERADPPFQMFRCMLPIIPCWIVGCMTNTEYQHISWIFRILTYILHWVAPLIQINELCHLFFCEVALVAFCCSDPVVMIALWVRCVRCDCGPEHGNEKRPNLSL